MTLKSFYRALKKVAQKYNFYLTRDGKIRVKIKSKSCCPLTAVYYDKTGKRINMVDATDTDLLSDNEITKIMKAADTKELDNFDIIWGPFTSQVELTKVRSALLRNTNLA